MKFKQFIPGVALFLVLALLGYEGHKLFLQSQQSVKDQQKSIEMQMAGLKAMTGKDGRFLLLEQELIKIAKSRQSSGASNLDLDTPSVALKLCELEERYRDDGMELSMLLGIIQVESNFDPKATSTFTKDGKAVPLAKGLMQVLDSTAAPYLQRMGQERSPNTLYNPLVNLEVGAAIMIDEHRTWMGKGLEDLHDWHLSLDAYFWGDRWVAESISGSSNSRTTFATMSYWAKVKAAQNLWKEKGF